jgi:hypothetical protein
MKKPDPDLALAPALDLFDPALRRLAVAYPAPQPPNIEVDRFGPAGLHPRRVEMLNREPRPRCVPWPQYRYLRGTKQIQVGGQMGGLFLCRLLVTY